MAVADWFKKKGKEITAENVEAKASEVAAEIAAKEATSRRCARRCLVRS